MTFFVICIVIKNSKFSANYYHIHIKEFLDIFYFISEILSRVFEYVFLDRPVLKSFRISCCISSTVIKDMNLVISCLHAFHTEPSLFGKAKVIGLFSVILYILRFFETRRCKTLPNVERIINSVHYLYYGILRKV